MHKANHFKLKPPANPLRNLPQRKSTPTEQISSKMTSKTLVEFRTQNAQLPEWRLQLQNAVQQRLGAEKKESAETVRSIEPAVNADSGTATGGPETQKVSTVPRTDNRYLANALKRIESSRNRYLVPEPTPERESKEEPTPKKDFPFTIAARTEKPEKPAPNSEKEPVNEVKPKLVKKAKLIRDLYDTSELDPNFPPARLSSSFSGAAAAPAPEPKNERVAPPEKIEVKIEAKPPAEAKLPAAKPETAKPQVEAREKAVEPPVTEEVAVEITESEEYDDYASFGVRFNAGVFDFLIGSFLSFVLLLPFIIAGGSWFTPTGLLAFVATCSIVMFIYLTMSVGLAGKSFGMHIFSLEMIDIGGENYPTFHQSAVSAAIYLASVAFLGLGFATALFDEDRRTAHDLLSGTLVVREL